MICRMCLLDSTEALKIFADEKCQFNIAATIAQHFWFEPKDDDPISNIVCNSCWWKIESFHIYYLSIEEAHRKLSERFSVKQEDSYHHRHADAGIQVYFKLEEDNSVEDSYENCVEGSEITVIETAEDMAGQDTTFDEEENNFNELVEASAVESEQVEEVLESSKEEVSIQIQTCSEEAATRRSKYLEAQKNLEEFIKIETVENALVNDDGDGDSDDAPLIRHKRKRRKTGHALSASDENSKSKTSKSTSNEYLLKSKEDDLKIAKHMKLKCDLCESDYPTFAEVKRHYRNVHKRKGYVVCCNKKLYKRVLILDHVNKHLNPDYFKCNECNKVFADKQCLKNHMIRHESDDAKLFRCEHCPRRFPKQYLLDQHKFIHTPQEERQYFCEDCGKAFPTNNLLQTHRRYVHENAYGQMCHICAKVIRGKRLFAKHQLEHAGVTEPRVQCEICGAWLKHQHSLKKHLMRHEEAQNQHICTMCGKVAPSKGALRSHIHYVHASARSFKCSVCDKGFKKAIVLKEHMTTHTGEVLYTCPHCPKTFNSHANMHAHRKKVHRKEWEERRKNRGCPTENLNTANDSSENGNNISEICENSLENLPENSINVVLYETVS
ncbi:unnamed protein product [Hermetia illucens]|uniref:Transcription factor grauzone n=1 Tax=Hermetia illucens TaxID=343691 RepID=A0A7R8YM31_HERIL|nr:unnamed protein product [Hermetia illucens]